MKRAHVTAALAAFAALAAGIVVKADLIGVSGEVGIGQTYTSFIGSVSYTAGGALTLNSTPDAGGGTQFFSLFKPDNAFRFHVPGNNAVSINILVPNPNGSGYAGSGGLDFVMYGQVDTDGSVPYDGIQADENRGASGPPLLGGSLLQFGFDNQPQRVDFRFALDASSSPQWIARYLMPDPGYTGGTQQVHDIGLSGTFEGSTMPAWNTFPAGQEFGQSFTGGSKNELVPIACGSSIGDFVWNDLNGNGRQDQGEPGIDGVKLILDGTTAFMGVPVHLEVVSAPTGPGGTSGFYQFTNLCLGSYTIGVDLATAPAGFSTSPVHSVAATALDDSDTPGGTAVTITAANYVNGVQTVDFGFVPPPPICTGVIGDFVWFDASRDGLQDFEMVNGIGGVRVRLTRPDLTIAEFVTGGSGAYQFTGLCAGHYKVEVVSGIPPGLAPTSNHVGLDAAKDSDAPSQELDLPDDASSDLTIDFGYSSICGGQIGDFVWIDSNGNGVQDNGEPGIAGWTVELNGGPGMTSTVTDANGYYRFDNLCAGNYTVKVLSPVGYGPTLYHQGAANGDSDANGQPVPVILATDTSTNYTVDFGYLTQCSGTIGNFVFQDSNENGIYDGLEVGLNGLGAPVHIILTRLADNAVLQNVVQDSNGFYQFVGVCPGQYRIDVQDPTGYTPSPTSPPGLGTPSNDSNPSPTFITLTAGSPSDDTIDFGYIPVFGQAVPVVSLSVSKTDNTTTYTPGGVLTYTVAVSNFGPRMANSVQVRDARPAQVTSWSWACTGTTGTATLNTCSPGTAANFMDFITLPANSSIIYTVTANVAANATNPLQNTVLVNAMGGAFNLGTYCVTNLNGDAVQRTFDSPNGRVCSSTDIDIPAAAHLIINKVVTNTHGGALTAAGFSGTVGGTVVTAGGNSWAGASTDKTITTPGSYTVSENAHPGYDVTFDAGCSGSIAAGETKTCTVTNTDQAGTLVVNKVVVNDHGGTKKATDFSFVVNGGTAQAFGAGADDLHGTKTLTVSAGTYTVTEPATAGYAASFSGCTNIVVANGGMATCTITNNDAAATLIVNKVVINNDGGTKKATDFSFVVNGGTAQAFGAGADVLHGTKTLTVSAGTYTVTEPATTGYAASLSGCAGIVLANGSSATCTIANDDVAPPTRIDLSLTKTAVNVCKVPATSSHYDGDHCDHEGHRGGHSDNDGCAHERDTHRHYPGDACAHEARTAGHADGDNCDHDRAVHHHTTGDACAHEQRLSGHFDGDGCNHERDTRHFERDNDDHEKHINGHSDGDACAHERHLNQHYPGDSCDHEKLRFGHYPGDACDHEKSQTCPTVPTVGGTLVFTLTVRNAAGLSQASGVVVTDAWPAGLTFVSATASQGSYVGSTGIWTVGSLASGAAATLRIVATVATAGLKTNFAQVTAAGQQDVDSTPNNHSTVVEDDEAAAVFTPAPLPCAGGTFDFTGSDYSSGTAGNTRTFAVNGVNVHVRGFGKNKSTSAVTAAYVGRYSHGLGVTDSSEGSGGNDLHTVGNTLQYDYLLFEFDRPVILDKMFLDYVIGGSGTISVWLNNTYANPYGSPLTLAQFTALVGGAPTETNSGSGVSTYGTRTADINTAGTMASVVVVAAKIGNSSDRFKLHNLTIACAPPVVADLKVAKSNNATGVAAGSTASYTIVVSNAAGSSPVGGALLKDPAVANFTVTGVSCAGGTNGAVCPPAAAVTPATLQGAVSTSFPVVSSAQAGGIPVTLPENSSLTFVVTGTVARACGATAITNTATIAAPPGVTDTNTANNSATDTDPISGTPTCADLQVSISDGVSSAYKGGTLTYTIRVTNAGPATVTGAKLQDAVVNGLAQQSVACTSAYGNTCTSAPALASLQAGTLSLPALASGKFFEIKLTAKAASSGYSSVTNTAVVAAPAGIMDSVTSNNQASDTDTLR